MSCERCGMVAEVTGHGVFEAIDRAAGDAGSSRASGSWKWPVYAGIALSHDRFAALPLGP